MDDSGTASAPGGGKELLERYRAERERRLSRAAVRLHHDSGDDFPYLLADPYTVRAERAPVADEVDVLVVGGGFGGLLAAARLTEAGVGRVRIVEAGGDVGGAWYWNRHPGAACDIESYIYFPLLEETGYMPTERYAKAPEIRRHCRRIAERFALYRRALLSTQVTTLAWSRGPAAWHVATDRGDCIVARFLVLASGPLNRPKHSAIPGLVRWAQLPHEPVGLCLYRRRPDRHRMGGHPAARLATGADRGHGGRRLDRIGTRGPQDGGGAWRNRRLSLAARARRYGENGRGAIEIDRIVQDAATAEALKPWFSLFCKRPCFQYEYLSVFNRPNVTLVDTQGRGVERITETGAVVSGREYAVDCLIFATGFEVGTGYPRRSGFEVRGADGLTLTQKWGGGLSTLHGMHVRGFPNCFVMSQGQSGMSPHFPHMLGEQARHLAHIVGHCIESGFRTVEATEDAELAWVETIRRTDTGRRAFLESCTPGYYNNEGCMSDAAALGCPYGPGAVAFVELLRRWRSSGDFEGQEFDGPNPNATARR